MPLSSSWVSWIPICLMVIQIAMATQYGNFNSKQTKNIIVDQSGKGQFTTLQSAIDSIPQNNGEKIIIYIKAGVYKEKVTIPPEKPFLTLQGDGMHKTTIIWGDHANLEQSVTYKSLANNIAVIGISFVNSFNYPRLPPDHRWYPAAAAKISGDKTTFYECGFFGFQDTLWDDQGRHYYKNCRIEGAVDFIFGAAQSIYENCEVQVNSDSLGLGLAGFIAAHGRDSPDETSGFVFRGCRVKGGLTYLGRAWRPYAKVLFHQTYIENSIVPQGWVAWSAAGKEFQLTFAEVACNGPSYNTLRRVKWVVINNLQRVSEMATLAFIDTDGWTRPFSDHA